MSIYDRDYYKEKVKKEEDPAVVRYKKFAVFMKWLLIISAIFSFIVWLLAVFTRGNGYGG
ncbi:hypothetical protein [Desulfurobacterium atlanticum]|uniref:Aa3 type cytochrome c oxidase subunit IV n=1 Tax=Desulfurobacterium atlanticum TaxID=240169 RepID=A0A238YNC6_9BACT|nr:hypothetical protein [Desulfurobacterium atlanticum]SNR72512.1 hypothetical protein SAMN06265340_10450 [Desulfurobacterium atlanticum]